MEKISVVVPCYNEEKSIPLFFEEFNKSTKELSKKVDFEIIFVNDGSKDNTLQIIKELNSKDERVKYISFSRNFGKESAIYAGLENASGDYVTLMDADLQDPPSLLPEMYKAVTEEDYDAVGTRRKNRKGEPIIRSFFSKLFYKIIDKLTDFKMVDGARDYVFMKRPVVDAIISLKEYNRYSKGLFSFVGFNTFWIEFETGDRVAGTSKYSFWKLFKYAMEGIVSFSTTPLVLSALIGLLFCLVAFILLIVIIVKTLVWGDPVSGWPSLACIVVFFSGIQLFFLGVIGMYLSKTYLEVKKRPIYIVKETEKDLQ